MKYTWKKLTLFTLLTVTLAVLAGCGTTPAAYTAKSYAAAAGDVASLTIDVRDRKIEFLESDDDQLHLAYYESEKEYYTLVLSEKKLTVTCAENKAWTDYVGGKASLQNRTLQVFLPSGALQGLCVKTTNESLTLPAFTINGETVLEVNGGDITLQGLAAGGNVSLTAKNGDITGTLAGNSDDFTIVSSVKKGESNLPAQGGTGGQKLDVSVNNGNIDLQFWGK